MGYSMTWDLDIFFKGGSSSNEFLTFLDEINEEVKELDRLVSNINPEGNDESSLIQAFDLYKNTNMKSSQASAFIGCLEAQNAQDKKAGQLRIKQMKIVASLKMVLSKLDEKLIQHDDAFFEKILEKEPLNELKFVLNERREKAKEKLSVKEEALITQLAMDGFEGWSQMYDTIVGSMTIPYKGEKLSVGQAANKFSDPDERARKELFTAWEQAWEEKSDLFARTLNHLAGFRLSVNEKRGWDDILKEPLEIGRMKKETLESMWNVIADHKEPLVRFLKRKAELLDLDKLSWADLDAPLAVTAESKVMDYQEGADFIIQQFAKFGSQLANFTQKAFEDSWIEAEDRPGKRPGGFCTGFPLNKQSRIFMTYSGTPSNVSTLAHELGHAFHSYAMRDIHPLNRSYAMNVAETASTFAEMVVADAAVKEAASEEEKLVLLEDKIQRSVALLMNIHARYLFETRFYDERKQGYVSAERLNELMVDAQKEAYGDALSDYNPTFWASKLHFYITGVPFYNFPYTFGYLFSLGIYANALKEPAGFEEKYIALLKDTGSMKVEDLAEKHLGVDLKTRDFWEEAVNACMEDVEEFMRLTDPLVRKA
ncbi:M3 family oligoendopeptidase [Peribacillus simplex]|uniref:M3 family oligoendopeptidase n=1 Tax=Bacillaceae TaxID=186817 RepID=UPI000660A130|nr:MULTISPECIES: M3 family oligoendopeptidase [Bacillaceae]MBD8587856.1 M3 family oligoendopeptidase [Peribacillus simplex]MCF7623582.1 M3 family oligoendopeptidase [Peribacillus frigoritolerans]MCP1154136.1 M3 family oligoendopeptidase [Peribacillus frigoritolerans]MCT1389417.1 M3 family oligoendopeptidase [Peribacillus frigoritolerans]MEA3573872.1 M3 family oligoendopeptidase [Peribacillus frigoritolerans]